MLLDKTGLNINTFEPVLAEVLGSEKNEEGHKVLSEAIVHGRAQVQLRDWLYCLVKTPGTLVRRHLIDLKGKQPEAFVDGIESGIDTHGELMGLPPDRLTAETVAPAVLTMLDAAERLAKENGRTKINEAVLIAAILKAADEKLKYLLTSWATEAGMKAFITHVYSQIKPLGKVDVFDNDGKLNIRLFTLSGRTFCQRLREDAQSLGVKRLTTRHILYTLLGNETGLLTTALAVSGFEVKKELHSSLSRQLASPGRKRNDDFEISRDTVFDAVVQVFSEAFKLAHTSGRSKIAEFDISHAFVSKQSSELTRLTTGGKQIDLAALRIYIDSADYEEEEEQPLYRFSIQEIEQNIKQRIRGQNRAIDKVIPWIKRFRFGIPRDERPAAVFLFLGPTGSGKTQLAKELARYVFGDEDMMIYLEMGQYKTKESMNMFIGAPPGYVGYGEGKLTNGLRDKPECVVLFDEIEKADTQVFDTVLRFADEGIISDPAGPVRNGRKCIIVMTTNAGQGWLRDHLKKNPSAAENPEALSDQLFEEAMKELQEKGFRPEFLGRVDERIVFLPFTEKVCRKIVDDVLEKELEKFKKFKGVSIKVEEEARKILASEVLKRSYDEGARGAPRVVNEFIVTPVIDLLMEAEDEASMPTHLIASKLGLSKIKLEILR